MSEMNILDIFYKGCGMWYMVQEVECVTWGVAD